MKIPHNLNGYKLFSALGIFFLGLEFLAIILTLLGIFYWPILAIFILIGLLALTVLFFHNRKALNNLQLVILSLFSILAIAYFSFHAEPSVFSGRDQGSFSEAAARLSQNHKLPFETTSSREFFGIYGPGTALNYPGFNYNQEGELITHFSIGYIAWLAVFYSLFGLAGYPIANGILFFIFLLSFFALVKIHGNQRTAWFGLFLTLSTFTFSWFLKLTLGENLALGFVWFALLEISLFLKYRDQVFFFAALSTLLLLTFTRLEAWALLFMLGGILFVLKKKEKALFLKVEKQKIFWLLGIFLLSYLATIKINSQFYISSLKGLVHSFSFESNGLSAISALVYLGKIFNYYGILILLIIEALGLLYFLRKKNYSILIPFFITTPLLIYIVHSGISPDHPWMLRRFSFAIIPMGIFYTALLINQLFVKKIYFFTLSTVFIITNLIFSLPLMNFSENEQLLAQTKSLSESFSNTDLVLIDRLASGDGWSMIGAPMNFLYGKQAVYFFNPADLDKIDTKKFTNVYLIIPNESLALYEKFDLLEKLIPQKEYQIERKHLVVPDLSQDSILSRSLPFESQTLTKGKVYLLKR
ncbi:MAG: hypothetical protein WAV73_03945 [Candidatus Moraniibacteriota bacterium]